MTAPQTPIPDFAPRFVDEPFMGLAYEDGRVLAAVDIVEAGGVKTIVIHEWSSFFPSRGHSVEALRWFRAQGFTDIVANGVGLIEDGIGDISTAYWQHMHTKGLVDVLLDDNGADITPAHSLTH